MRMFVQLNDLKSICEECGFADVLVDMSNSEMQFEIEDEEDMAQKKEVEEKKEYNEAGRRQIHGASKEFDHL